MKTPIKHSLMKALSAVPGFDLLGDPELLEIVGASMNLVWPAGETIFKKGNPGEALYIVLSGNVRIYEEFEGSDLEVTRTGPGDYFGEMSLLLDTTHTKNAVTLEETELLVLPKESFSALLASNEKLRAHIESTFQARRLESSERHPTSKPALP